MLNISQQLIVTEIHLETVAPVCSVKKVFLEILQNSQENICARVFFFDKLAGLGISPYLVRMLENANQNNSEYGHFLHSAEDLLCLLLFFTNSLGSSMMPPRDTGYQSSLN